MNFADPSEVLFLEECCKFTLDPAKADKMIFLFDTHKQYCKGKSNISISQNQDILESCILERLKYPNTNPFVLLVQIKKNIDDLKERPWYNTPEILHLIESFRDLVQNYLMTILQYPEQFSPQRCISEREMEQNSDFQKLVARLFDIFDSTGFDLEIHSLFIERLGENYDQNQLHSLILQYSRICVSKFNIYNDQLKLYFEIFNHYLSDPKTRELILFDQIAKWNVKTLKGDILEKEFVLGPLFTISLLQENQYVRQRAHQSLKGKMTKRQFENLLRQFQQTNYDHVQNLVALIRLCFSKNTFQQTIQFLNSVCLSNKFKTKEGYQQNRQLKQVQGVSSDGFLLNLYDTMLSISNKISSRNDDTFNKIDKSFWYTIPFENDQMLLNSQIPLSKQNINIGNVSYFFFYTLKLVDLGIMPILVRMKEIFKEMQEKRDVLEVIKDHPQEQIVKAQLEAQDEEAHQLEVVIFNPGRIKDTIQLFDTFIYLFKDWLNVDKMIDGFAQWQKSDILNYIPEFLINNLIYYIEFYIQNFQGFTEQYFNHQKLVSFTELAMYFIHLPIATNKYLAGQFIQIIYYFTKVSKKSLNLSYIFVQNDLIRENLLIGLIKQYSAVGETGANNQFYVKFQYRLYINDLLFQLLKIGIYQQQFQKYMEIEIGQRLIKHMISDMNYGFEEIWMNYLETYKKKIQQEISNNIQEKYNKKRELDMIKGQIQSNLQNMKSNLKLLVEFSNYFPKVLMNEIFQEMILRMLNYYLDNLLSEKSKEKLQALKEIAEKEFQLAVFLHQIGSFFANICDENKVVSIVVKDDRSYHIQNFLKLEKIFRQNIAGQQDKVERLSRLIYNLELKAEKKKFFESILEQTQIPEKYQDPINGELIKDPVLLPQSKTIMDRKVIITALLEKKQDPFTQTPLDVKDLIPLPELKKEIEAWTREIKKQRDIKVAEASKNKMQTEITFQQTSNFGLQDDEEDVNVFKGNKYEDD